MDKNLSRHKKSKFPNNPGEYKSKVHPQFATYAHEVMAEEEEEMHVVVEEE